MTKVITYGTYDLLHYGHINLLKRAKELGDYLIVGVTTDNFDRSRGKLFVHQSLEERIAAVKATGLADEVIIEEYDGQKIDDIKKYNIDIFAIGSDWKGIFDYIGEYCKLVYLPRTEGVSSTEMRNAGKTIKIGICGYSQSIGKFINESRYISGMAISDYYIDDNSNDLSDFEGFARHSSFEEMLETVDAVYIVSAPAKRYSLIKKALDCQKHVLCESPVTLCASQTAELYELADKNGVVLCEALKTAFSLAFQRMCLLLKTGIIGNIKSIDATCTSLWVKENWFDDVDAGGGAVSAWGSYTILPAIKLFGLNYKSSSFVTLRNQYGSDIFTKIQLVYPNGVATLNVGTGVKSEGNLVISGTKGYIYVPSPWWKTEYFEVRKEDSRENRKFFYQFEGEGIRYELAEFIKHIRCGYNFSSLSSKESIAISEIIEGFKKEERLTEIK